MSDVGWGEYSRWFSDAMALINAGRDKEEIFDALEQCRSALDDIFEALAPEGSSPEADSARRIAATARAQVAAIEQEVRATRQ